MTTQTSRRTGGRTARRSARAAPLPDHLKPVRAGMKGGTFSPLSKSGMDRIHQAALDALETIGLSQAPQTGVEYLTAAGAKLGDDGRIRFPRALVEDTIARANRSVTLMGRDPRHDMELSGTRVHYGTAGAAVHLVEANGRQYRDSTLQDVHDAARIADVLDNLHFLQRPWWPVILSIIFKWISTRSTPAARAPPNTSAFRLVNPNLYPMDLTSCI